MGYLILNTDRDDEMKELRHNMRRSMRHEGTMPYMRHHDDEKSWEDAYRMGYRHGAEDMEDEHYRRRRDSIGRYV